MRRATIFLVALVGCGGDPFVYVASEALTEGGAPAVESPDARAPDSPESPDAGSPDAAPIKLRHDAGPIEAPDAAIAATDAMPSEASADAGSEASEASPIDAAIDVDATPRCTPVTPFAVQCGPLAGIGAYGPGQYCLNVGVDMPGQPMPTPIACQCAETFNCACLGDVCPAGHALIACGVGNGPALREDCR